LPIGQVYGTLSRLERDGQIEIEGAAPGDGPERKRYGITPAGVARLEDWLGTPEQAEPYLHRAARLLVTMNARAGAIESARTAIEAATNDAAPTLPWAFGELKGLETARFE
jgi:DNA-binding PadR family transcriptional regulator